MLSPYRTPAWRAARSPRPPRPRGTSFELWQIVVMKRLYRRLRPRRVGLSDPIGPWVWLLVGATFSAFVILTWWLRGMPRGAWVRWVYVTRLVALQQPPGWYPPHPLFLETKALGIDFPPSTPPRD